MLAFAAGWDFKNLSERLDLAPNWGITQSDMLTFIRHEAVMMGRIFSGLPWAAFGIALSALWPLCGSGVAETFPTYVLEHQNQAATDVELSRSRSARMAPCTDDVVKFCSRQEGFGEQSCLRKYLGQLSSQCREIITSSQDSRNNDGVPPCLHSPVCFNPLGGDKASIMRAEWKQSSGYTYAYPLDLPNKKGGVAGAALDSKGNIWVFQRNAPGQPQLFEFASDHHLIRTVGEDVTGRQYKAHGIAVDPQDNVWICDANGSTVEKISPDGKLLMTIGVTGHRGDWDEAKGQRLLWQPLDVAFAPNGDIYIGGGHRDESPDDADSDDPANNVGAARVIHLDRTGKFINQWYGNNIGPGKFSMVHGIAVDPHNGDVWVADREEYRLVVFTAQGNFIKTVQMKNLMCAVYFDPHGGLWVATGNDGQVLKINPDGKVLVAAGKGRGVDPGELFESNFMGMDPQGDLYVGDTTIPRVLEIVAPKH
jgi:DNA-binding beta-propeller fold protein YncE